VVEAGAVSLLSGLEAGVVWGLVGHSVLLSKTAVSRLDYFESPTPSCISAAALVFGRRPERVL